MVKVFKTYEIDNALWVKITEGFNESFDKNIPNTALRTGYCISNVLGYAYHAIDLDDKTGEVRGFHTFFPAFYQGGIKAVIGGNTYVRKKYRKDAFVFYDLEWALRDAVAAEGYVLEAGVPNHNSREYARKFLNTKYVANLDYYILPLNLSKTLGKRSLKNFDGIVRLIVKGYSAFQGVISNIFNRKEKAVKFSLDVNEDFLRARFRNPKYIKYEENGVTSYYTIVDENGSKAAYLMDFREKGKKTKRALAKTVRFIIKKEAPDAILYVGFLKMRQHVLLKVPSKYEPKHLPLTYYILNNNEERKFEGIDDPQNWDFSLINFDVR